MNNAVNNEPFRSGQDHESRRIHLIITEVIAISVTIIVVGFRIHVRRKICALGLDDWLVLISLIFAILFTACTCVSTGYGWTYHISDMQDTTYLLDAAWIAELIFTPTVSLVKASILVFYLRLTSKRPFRQAVYAGLLFVTLWFLVFEVLIAMTCDSMSDPIGFNGARTTYCVRLDPTPIYHGTTNIISDCYVLVLPMRLVWQLKMPRKRRIGLMCLFAAGGIVCIFGTLRLIWAIMTNASHDFSWNGFHVWLWASLELDLGIICASFPALKPLITKMIPSCDGPCDPADREQRGPRHILPKLARGHRVTMRLSAIHVQDSAVQNFWISDVASPGEEKITRSGRNKGGDVEEGRRDGSQAITITQQSSEIDTEGMSNLGIRKTIEFRLVDNAGQ